MGFTLRDKSLFWTLAGWKNNWAPKSTINPTFTSPDCVAGIGSVKDSNSFLRMVQSYRNYSRIAKRFLYGDALLEQALQMELRVAFRLPFNVSTPVHLVKEGCERKMADQLDRDYQLLTYNAHPFQLYTYKLHNQRIRQQNEMAQKHQANEKTEQQVFEEVFGAEIEEQAKKLPLGEKLSLEKMTQIFKKVTNAMREHKGQNDQGKGKDGQYHDYLEKRRPFDQAEPLRYSH